MKILDHQQINQKIKRLAIEIVENNFREKEIFLMGINNNGLVFARMLYSELQKISSINFNLNQIRLNPAAPLSTDIIVDIELKKLNNKTIIVVDDVANTGRTIFYAIKPLLTILPKKVEVAVLVDRTHKAFPIKVDFYGLSLATTSHENIDVRIRNVEKHEVFLT